MEENYPEYLFTPKYFERDLKKIFSNLNAPNHNKTLIKGTSSNRIFKIEKPKSCTYMVNSLFIQTSLITDLSPALLLEQIKEHKQLHQWFPYVNDATLQMRINQYCDVLEIVCYQIKLGLQCSLAYVLKYS